jgi:hypothetical protein
MKRATLTIAAISLALSVFGQGTVNFNNTPGTLILTNWSAVGGGIGGINGAGGPYYFGLFVAPVGQNVGSSSVDLFAGPWTFTGVYATNTAAAGRLSGSPGTGVPVPGWGGGTSMDYVVAGWHSSLGHDWSVVGPLVQGPHPEYLFAHSVIGEGISGGGPLGQPVLALFGAVAPSIQGFQFPVTPEPSILSFTGLAAAAMLIRRRRK